MARLCIGELDWPDKRGEQQFVQIVFLQALASADQAPLRELYGRPFQLFRKAINDFKLNFHSITQPWRLTGAEASLAEMLESEIEAWTTKWNLNATWCMQVAYATLLIWSSSSREITELVFQHPGGASFVPNAPNSPDGLPQYTPYWGSRDGYLAGLRRNALKQLSEHSLLKWGSRKKAESLADSILVEAENYCCAVEAAYLKSGWKRCRKRKKRNLNEHLKWTVEFQVHEKPFAQIALQSRPVVSAKAVAKAVREMLGVMLLKERGGVKRGRPKGSRTIFHAHNPSK